MQTRKKSYVKNWSINLQNTNKYSSSKIRTSYFTDYFFFLRYHNMPLIFTTHSESQRRFLNTSIQFCNFLIFSRTQDLFFIFLIHLHTLLLIITIRTHSPSGSLNYSILEVNIGIVYFHRLLHCCILNTHYISLPQNECDQAWKERKVLKVSFTRYKKINVTDPA